MFPVPLKLPLSRPDKSRHPVAVVVGELSIVAVLARSVGGKPSLNWIGWAEMRWCGYGMHQREDRFLTLEPVSSPLAELA